MTENAIELISKVNTRLEAIEGKLHALELEIEDLWENKVSWQDSPDLPEW